MGKGKEVEKGKVRVKEEGRGRVKGGRGKIKGGKGGGGSRQEGKWRVEEGRDRKG